MKSRTMKFVAALVCVAPLALPAQLAAQHHHYKLGAAFTLTENAASPFQAGPRQSQLSQKRRESP